MSEDTVQVTFVLTDVTSEEAVSVVGDFNEWQPGALAFNKTSRDSYEATTTLPAGRQYVFRYLTEHGRWFDETAADGFYPNEYGSGNCLLLT